MRRLKGEHITPACSFRDKSLELSFETQSFQRLRRSVTPLLLACMAIFLLFFVPDLVESVSTDTFVRNFLTRAAADLLFFGFYCAFGRFKNSRSYFYTVNFSEGALIVVYIFLLAGYQNLNFLVRCMDIIIITTLFFTVPNKWLNSLLLSLSLIAAFSVFSLAEADRYTLDQGFFTGSCYIALSLAINALTFYHEGFTQRTQFYNITMLKRLLNTDTLTGAYTRAKFNEELKKQILMAKRSGRLFSLTIFDIDNFKHINDTYGHIEGDRVLTGIADAVTQNKRPKDILTRWGGEEFVLLFPGTGLDAAVKITDRLRYIIASTVFGIGERVTCSFGVTVYQQTDTPITLLNRADGYMYDAKAAGKNIVTSDLAK